MNRKTGFFIFACLTLFILMNTVAAVSESESDVYIFNINEGDIFIEKSPSSDFRSAGDLLKVTYADGDVVDFIPAEVHMIIVGNGTATSNSIIVNGKGLSEQTVFHLILKDTLWDARKTAKQSGSDVIYAKNNPKVELTFLENNTLIVDSNLKARFEDGSVVYFDNTTIPYDDLSAASNGTIKFKGFEISENGTAKIGSLSIDNETVRIGMLLFNKEGVRLNKETDFVQHSISGIGYLITVFLYFF